MTLFMQYNEAEALSKYGSRGNEVRTIQDKLKRWGYYNGSVDGIYGTKTVAAVIVVRLIFGSLYADSIYMLMLYTAAGVILGHNYPFYLNFKGGKGIAATAGLIAALGPWFILVEGLVFIIVFTTTHYVSLGSLLVYVALIIHLILFGQNGLLPGMTQTALNEMYIVALFLMAMAFWRHRSNIKKLIEGTERKTYISKKNKLD